MYLLRSVALAPGARQAECPLGADGGGRVLLMSGCLLLGHLGADRPCDLRGPCHPTGLCRTGRRRFCLYLRDGFLLPLCGTAGTL